MLGLLFWCKNFRDIGQNDELRIVRCSVLLLLSKTGTAGCVSMCALNVFFLFFLLSVILFFVFFSTLFSYFFDSGIYPGLNKNLPICSLCKSLSILWHYIAFYFFSFLSSLSCSLNISIFLFVVDINFRFFLFFLCSAICITFPLSVPF